MHPQAPLSLLDERVSGCRACPRLVAWREEVAREKRAAFREWTYWGRPVPGFGPADARLLVLGLAPAAHGGNRTGRMFTGDRSGDVLYQALYDVGLASQPESVRMGDGLELYGVRITAPVHCAPPENKPTPGERDACRHWLVEELTLLRPTLRAVVVLGAFGWQAMWPALTEAGWEVPRPRPVFGHGVRVRVRVGSGGGVGTSGGVPGVSGRLLDAPGRVSGVSGVSGGVLEAPGRDPEAAGRASEVFGRAPRVPGQLPDTPGRVPGAPGRPPGTSAHGTGTLDADADADADPAAPAGLDVFGCFHVSQRNTFTGKLTPEMLREVLGGAGEVAGVLPRRGGGSWSGRK